MIGRTNTGGGGSGATLTIMGVAGATVTASKDGKTYTRTINNSGTAVFKGLASGTWTITMSGNGHTTTRTVTITADYDLTIAYFSATINITYPAKSTCVIKNSSGTQVGSDTNTGTAAKTWTATVGATGTYTITATDGSGKTKSTTVSITTNGQNVSATLAYKNYLFNKGQVPGIDWDVVDIKEGYASASISTTINGSTNGGDIVNQGWSVSTTTKINTIGYTKLCANVTSITPNGLFLGISISNKVEAGYSDLQAYLNITQKGEVSVDISSIKTSGYIGLGRNWWQMDASQLTVDQVWLE